MLLAIIFLVCEHPDKFIPNIIIPFQGLYLIKSKNTGSTLLNLKNSLRNVIIRVFVTHKIISLTSINSDLVIKYYA